MVVYSDIMQPLPIDPHLPEILSALRSAKHLVLQASPGSGKTTRIPPALLSETPKQILVLEPRRLAAKYAAIRVAEELRVEVGSKVGYHFRFEKKISAETRILFLTEGMLVRYLLEDPKLSNASLVILDEFHERHLQTDMALGLLKQLQNTTRPDLKILIMSATLDLQTITQYLEGAKAIEVKAHPFPIETTYLESAPKKYLDALVADAVRNQLERKPEGGHLLVFLPGMSEIKRAEQALGHFGTRYGIQIHTLHGEMDRGDQDSVLKKSSQRKVILSTNIAESSLTIDKVDCVIDSGLERVMQYDPWTGIPTLVTRTISKASATQRAGRAGRQGPGTCYRLYTSHDYSTWQPFHKPEILRADLSQSLLELMKLTPQVETFGWFEKPPESSLNSALTLLQKIGAIDSNRITEIGERIARIPIHPRLSRVLLEAEKQGCLGLALRLVALLSEGQLQNLDATEGLHLSPSFQVSRTEKRLREFFRDASNANRERLPFCVLTGFPDRVAQRRSEGNRAKTEEVELVFCQGGHATIQKSAFALDHEFFVILDLQDSKRQGLAQSKIRVHSACAMSEFDFLELEPNQTTSVSELGWSKEKERVVSSTQLKYGLLILEEKTEQKPSDANNAFQLFLQEGLRIKPDQYGSFDHWLQALERFCDKTILTSEFARSKLYLEKTNQTFDPARLVPALSRHLDGDYSFQKMKAIDWESFIATSLLEGDLSQMNRALPQFIKLTPQRRARVYYAMNQGPWIESRLQDFFGMKVGPSVMDGKVPLTLHLLAPNQRAVQVTSDLQGFWERSYPKLRQELGRRYPRHAWPENPLKVEKQKL